MLENVFKELQWEKKVVNINGTYLSNLRFADDVILISEEEEEIKEIIQELNENCLLYTSPSPRDRTRSRMPSSA